ncbi:MAG: hypothetical protein AABX33_05030 [Nanoarchaeota archaeon]
MGLTDIVERGVEGTFSKINEIRLNPTPAITNSMQFAMYNFAMQVGEVLQRTPLKNTWLSGHLSDVGLSGVLTSMGLLVSGKDKVARALSSILVPIALTLHEYYPVIHPEEGVFDYQDIACYWVAAAATYLVSELSHSEKFQKAVSKYINEKF